MADAVTSGEHAFISYVREDAARADELQELLRADGDLHPGPPDRPGQNRNVRERRGLIASAYLRRDEKEINMLKFHTKLRLRGQRAGRAAAWLAVLTPIAALAPLAGSA